LSENEARITIRILPNAARSSIVGVISGAWQIKIAAPPVEGKANRELIAFLSKRLAVRKSALRFVSGQTSRTKIISVNGLSQEEIIRRLSSELNR
jgi:uncharacterized protein (TIGR00251 family)